MQRVDEVVRRIQSRPQMLVISAHYNDDFYLKLRLMEAGFVDTPMAAAYPGCEGFTVYRDGRHEVLHIRLNNNWQLADMKQRMFTALRLALSGECPVIAKQEHAIIMRFGTDYTALDWGRYGLANLEFSHPMEILVAMDEGQWFKSWLFGWDTRRCCMAVSGIISSSHIGKKELDRLFNTAQNNSVFEPIIGGQTSEEIMKTLREATASRIGHRQTD
jgi:hypothetical protein